MEKTEVFSNEALVNDVVMGLHQSFGETNSYRGRYIAYFGVNSDCEIWNNTGKKCSQIGDSSCQPRGAGENLEDKATVDGFGSAAARKFRQR